MERNAQREIETQSTKSLATYSAAFNLTDRPATDISIVQEINETIYPQYSSLESEVLDFYLEPSEIYYWDLSSAHVYLQLKCVDGSGALLKDSDANSKSAPCNNIAGTLFQNLEISLRNVPVTNTSNHYHYVSHFNSALSYTLPVIPTEGKCVGYFP